MHIQIDELESVNDVSHILRHLGYLLSSRALVHTRYQPQHFAPTDFNSSRHFPGLMRAR
jgi:hypothetical protein